MSSDQIQVVNRVTLVREDQASPSALISFSFPQCHNALPKALMSSIQGAALQQEEAAKKVRIARSVASKLDCA